MPTLLAKYRVPGAVVSCITNGEVVWTKAFGLANLKTRAPMRLDMVFNHGSNGKFLTAWGIMRLVEQGKVELDASANRYLKRWQLRSSQFDPSGVTIYHNSGPAWPEYPADIADSLLSSPGQLPGRLAQATAPTHRFSSTLPAEIFGFGQARPASTWARTSARFSRTISLASRVRWMETAMASLRLTSGPMNSIRPS
jgi:hypothetical protein